MSLCLSRLWCRRYEIYWEIEEMLIPDSYHRLSYSVQ